MSAPKLSVLQSYPHDEWCSGDTCKEKSFVDHVVPSCPLDLFAGRISSPRKKGSNRKKEEKK